VSVTNLPLNCMCCSTTASHPLPPSRCCRTSVIKASESSSPSRSIPSCNIFDGWLEISPDALPASLSWFQRRNQTRWGHNMPQRQEWEVCILYLSTMVPFCPSCGVPLSLVRSKKAWSLTKTQGGISTTVNWIWQQVSPSMMFWHRSSM
jgi:hypothetical protein